jgi:hypothetical protein
VWHRIRAKKLLAFKKADKGGVARGHSTEGAKSLPQISKAEVSHCCITDTYVMPCGIPVVGSKVEGSHEALLDGQLGHVVDPNVPEELVQAIRSLLCGGSSRCAFQVKRHRMVDGTDSKDRSL